MLLQQKATHQQTAARQSSHDLLRDELGFEGLAISDALDMSDHAATYAQYLSYSLADFQHGPIALVEPDSPVFLVAPSRGASSDLRHLAEAPRFLWRRPARAVG